MNDLHQKNLIEAVKTNDLENVKYYIEYGMTEPAVFDEMHRSLLHTATENANYDMVRYLTERVGLNPLEGDINSKTPYDIAIEKGFTELISYFAKITDMAPSEIIHNPVRPGFFPDPSIVAVGEDYYMVNSSFIYFPCIPISHSTDLINWEIIGYAIDNPDYIDMSGYDPGRGFWAPDISYSDGRFYITATLRENDGSEVVRHQIIVSSDKPEGPYSKPVFIEEDGIDPSLFHDDDGKHYMLLNRGVRILELSSDLSEVITPPRLLYYGWNKHATEGPHLLKKDGYYYLFMAEGGTGDGHMITCARSRSLNEPFEPCPHNPLLTQRDPMAPLQRTGHGKPFLAHNGKWYITFLCSRKLGTKYSVLGRETGISEMTWNSDGWPVINKGNGPPTVIKNPFGAKLEEKEPSGLDYFEHEGLKLTRQTKIDFTARKDIFLSNLEEEYVPRGMIFYYDDNSFCTYGLTRVGTDLQLQICEKDPVHRISWRMFINPDRMGQTLNLYIISEGLNKVFAYGFNDAPMKKVAIIRDMFYLTDEGLELGKRFTGPLYGSYGPE